MATVLIPEIIEPGALYVPDANNFFTIATADLPNTDDALNCNGASGIYKAYQGAVNGIHYNAPQSGVEMGICFWYHPLTASSTSGSQSSTTTLLSCATQAWATSAGAIVPSTELAWWIGLNSASARARVFLLEAWSTANNNAATMATGLMTNAWHMVVFNRAASGAWSAYVDAVLVVTGTPPAAGTVQTLSPNMVFSIGAATVTGNPRSPNANTKIGKIAIKNGGTWTLQEQLDLLDSMQNGPPSP